MRSIRPFIVGAALAGMALMGGASAAPACTTTTSFSDGDFIVASSLTAGYCISVDNNIYGNFNLGNLPKKTVLTFNTDVVGGIEHYQLTFTGAYKSGTTYAWNYEVAIATGSPLGSVFTTLDADFAQTAGTSTLDKYTNPNGDVQIHMVKDGSNLQAGAISSSSFGLGITDLVISEVLKDHGTVSSVTNTVTVFTPPQNPDIPEPATLALMGAGLAGASWMRRKRRS